VIQLTSSQFVPAVQLAGTQTLTVTILWEAIGSPVTDYTLFVHLRPAGGATVAGFDQTPAGNRFPTHRWRAGDHILTTVPVPLPADLPAGVYEVWAGLYESASQGSLRLPVTGAAGQTTGDGEVRLGIVRIDAS
jgi:hypothetical protein